MERTLKERLILFSTDYNRQLGVDIAKCLDVELSDAGLKMFSSGAPYCRLESVRDGHVFIVGSHGRPSSLDMVNPLDQMEIMIDAARRGGAREITAVCPYFEARQDRRARPGEPITAKRNSDRLANAGATRIMSIDLHSGQVTGFFDGPFEHLSSLPVLSQYTVENFDLSNLTLVSPDAGGVKLVERHLARIPADVPLGIVHKKRDLNVPNSVKALRVIGDVKGRSCLLIDDIGDTGGTLVAAAMALMEAGALDVRAMLTHAVLSVPAVDRFKNSVLKEVIVTNTLEIGPEKQFDKLVVVSLAPMIAKSAKAVFKGRSVSAIFDGENLY